MYGRFPAFKFPLYTSLRNPDLFGDLISVLLSNPTKSRAAEEKSISGTSSRGPETYQNHQSPEQDAVTSKIFFLESGLVFIPFFSILYANPHFPALIPVSHIQSLSRHCYPTTCDHPPLIVETTQNNLIANPFFRPHTSFSRRQREKTSFFQPHLKTRGVKTHECAIFFFFKKPNQIAKLIIQVLQLKVALAERKKCFWDGFNTPGFDYGNVLTIRKIRFRKSKF